ncbi:MAG: DNA polymerase IV [Deltaproteobacteria bacterium]|nr:DNA polymerase IV [Deltaproteobacteria bacterium]
MERDILHLAIPAFPIALARIDDPALRERPVAVAAGASERAVIQSASAEARAEGVCEGLSVRHARGLCPALTLLPPQPHRIHQGMQALLKMTAAYSPVSEPVSGGQLFLDLTGCRRLLGPGRDVAARLDREIASGLRLQGQVGVAGNKLVSRIAAGCLDKPGVCDVLRGAEYPFIGPLPVSVLPGVGEARRQVLMQDLNLRRVEEIAALSQNQLRLAFGPFAPLLHQRARGVDPSPVQPPKRTPQILEESFLVREENDDNLLLAELCRLVESCGLRLRQSERETERLTLTIIYTDGAVEKRSSFLPVPLNHDLLLYEAAEELFFQACVRRVRLRGMRLLCDRLTLESGQACLFPLVSGPSPKQAALQEVLDRLRGRYGREAVRWGRALAL